MKEKIIYLLCLLLKRKFFKHKLIKSQERKKVIRVYGYEINILEKWLYFESIFQIIAPNGKLVYLYSQKCRPSNSALSFGDLIKEYGFFPQNCKSIIPLVKLLLLNS